MKAGTRKDYLKPDQPLHISVDLSLSPIAQKRPMQAVDLNGASSPNTSKSFHRSPRRSLQVTSASKRSPFSPFIDGMSDDAAREYVTKLEEEVVELEAELLWASGPLLEENETLARNLEELRTINQKLQKERDAAKRNLYIFIPMTIAALALMAGWTWFRESNKN